MKKRILNVGCGNDFYGTDRIDIVKTEATTDVVDIDNKILPYFSDTFDEIYCQYVLEHMKNPFHLILEMERVCKKNGKIIVITDNAGYIFFHIAWRGRGYHGDYSDVSVHGERYNKKDRHYYLYTQEHLRNLFHAADIKVEEMKYCYWKNISQRSFKSLFLHWSLSLFLSERFYKPSVAIVGRKK